MMKKLKSNHFNQNLFTKSSRSWKLYIIHSETEFLDVLQKWTFLKVIVKLITLSNLFTQERHY